MAQPSRPLEVLIVGCGNIAGGFDAQRDMADWPLSHAGAYRRNGGFRLAACVEPDPERRARFMTRWSVPTGAAAVQELEHQHFDVISICSPTTLHAGHLEQALALRPRAIFCEKPLTPSLAASRQWVQACEDQGVALAVNHTRRWAPDARQLRENLQSGAWGAVRSVIGHYNKGILNNGSHLLDLLLWLLGPLEVDWVGSPVADFWADDPTIPAVLRTSEGIPVHLSAAHAGDYALFELQIITARGTVAMEDGGLHWRLREAAPSPYFPGYRSLAAGSRSEGRYAEAMLNAASNLHDHLSHGTPLASTGRTALAAQLLCETIHQASSGRSIESLSPGTHP
ncbi:Gfo/Idh/MocA family protein [Polaromonas sp.]|uniref:Gfo/Idh/MocA family protein n=1 Tax=Polaromonas sp. TaxID=1869339 RepID=UPI003BA96AF8